MQFRDFGIITSKKIYGENSLVILVLTKHHGLIHSMVRKTNRNKFIFNLGNLIQLDFKQKQGRKFGTSQIELIKSFDITYIDNHLILIILQLQCSLISETLPENRPETEIFLLLSDFIENISASIIAEQLINFILKFLSLSGFELDYSKCAVSDKIDDLKFLSPKTGRAVSSFAAQGFEKQLIKYPCFLNGIKSPSSIIEMYQTLNFFINKFLYKEHNLKPFNNSLYYFYFKKLLNYMNKS